MLKFPKLTETFSISLVNTLEEIVARALAEFAVVSEPAKLEEAKAQYLGKTGLITEQMKTLGKLPPEDKKTAGAAINAAKSQIEEALNGRRDALKRAALEAQLSAEALDVTLPGRGRSRGGLHPVTRSLDRIEQLF